MAAISVWGDQSLYPVERNRPNFRSKAAIRFGRGRVARPFGFALTDPGRRLSRTRLFPEVTRVMPRVVSKDV